MSKAIIRPRMQPSRIALPPDMELRPSVQLVHQPRDRLAEDDQHRQAGHHRREQRDDQDGHQAAGPGRHLPARDPVRGHARQDATDHRADEAGGRVGDAVGVLHVEEVGGQPAQDEAGCDARAVGDRVGDVARQGREEQRERGLADDEEERPEVRHQPGVEQGVVETERLGVGEVEDAVVDGDVAVRADDLVAAEQEAERDEQTARGHERDHVGHAGHQDPAGAAAPRLLAAGARAATAVGGPLDPRRVGVVGVAQRFGDHRVGVVDRSLHAGGDHRLAGEAGPVAHPHVHGEDHRRRAGDGVVGQGRGPGRPLGLDVDLDPGPLGCLLERLGGHVGVGDAGRARGDGDQDPRPGRLRRCGGRPSRRRRCRLRVRPPAAARRPGPRRPPARGCLAERLEHQGDDLVRASRPRAARW